MPAAITIWQPAARHRASAAAADLAGHPAVLALTLANEIPPDIARWYGARRIEAFLDELAAIEFEITEEVEALRLATR